MDMRNKTTPEFRTVLDSPLGVPNSQVSPYYESYVYLGSLGVYVLSFGTAPMSSSTKPFLQALHVVHSQSYDIVLLPGPDE